MNVPFVAAFPATAVLVRFRARGGGSADVPSLGSNPPEAKLDYPSRVLAETPDIVAARILTAAKEMRAPIVATDGDGTLWHGDSDARGRGGAGGDPAQTKARGARAYFAADGSLLATGPV
jgi:hypothetical protein